MESKPTKIPRRPKLSFMEARLDGHMVAAISRLGGEPTLGEPTAAITDYPPAEPSDGVVNGMTIRDSPVCKQLSAHGRQTDRQTVLVSLMAQRVQASVLGGCVGGLCGLLRAWVPEHKRQRSPGLGFLSSRCAAGCS